MLRKNGMLQNMSHHANYKINLWISRDELYFVMLSLCCEVYVSEIHFLNEFNCFSGGGDLHFCFFQYDQR